MSYVASALEGFAARPPQEPPPLDPAEGLPFSVLLPPPMLRDTWQSAHLRYDVVTGNQQVR